MKRTLQVDLNTARSWYSGNNTALKELALRLFTEEELTFSYEKLVENVTTTTLKVDVEYKNKFKAQYKLRVLAKYFNSKYASVNRKQYFIMGIENGKITVGTHDSVRYPGVVYFNQERAIHEALQEFSEEEIQNLLS